MNDVIRLVLLNEAAKRLGIARGSMRDQLRAGLLPVPVRVNGRNKALLSNEVSALIGARLSGKTDDEVRALVKQLETARGRIAAELTKEVV